MISTYIINSVFYNYTYLYSLEEIVNAIIFFPFKQIFLVNY